MKNGKVSGETSKNKEMAVFSKVYLALYNGIQTAGWGYVLFQTLKLLIEKKEISNLWPLCGTSLIIFQSLALLEVLHSILGLVKSSALITFMQVFSRIFQVWGILIPVKEAQSSPALVLTLIAWGITETIRYSYYGLNILGFAPKLIVWLRYTLFIGLYPAGVLGETGNVYYALNTIKNSKMFSIALPNPLNISFNFYYATILLMLSYIPLFPKLYLHMFYQRKKILGASQGSVPKKLK